MEATLDPLLVHARLDAFRAHRRQPALLSSRKGGQIKQLTHDDTHVGWLLRNGKINEREARDTSAPQRPAKSARRRKSIRRSATWRSRLRNAAIFFCFAPTAWLKGFTITTW